MAKAAVFVVLCACLTLQLVTAFPYQNFVNSIEDNEIKSEELQTSKTTNSNDVDFRTSLKPVIFNTLAVIQDHSNTLILETTSFVADLLAELNTLPEENEYIEGLIPELTSLLERLEKIDLHSDSAPVLNEKAALLRAIAVMYLDFDRISKSLDDSSEAAVMKKVFQKLELAELNDRVNSSVKEAVQRFTVVFERFWNSLSAAQKEEHPDLSDWYERFQASENVQEKFKGFVEFVRILQGIVLKNIN